MNVCVFGRQRKKTHRQEHHTFQLHEIGAVVMDYSEQCSSITNIPHQVFQQWKEGQLSTGSMFPTIPYLTTRGRESGFYEKKSHNTHPWNYQSSGTSQNILHGVTNITNTNLFHITVTSDV